MSTNCIFTQTFHPSDNCTASYRNEQWVVKLHSPSLQTCKSDSRTKKTLSSNMTFLIQTFAQKALFGDHPWGTVFTRMARMFCCYSRS